MGWVKSYPKRTYYAFLFTGVFDLGESPVLGGTTASEMPVNFYYNNDPDNQDLWQYSSLGFNDPVIRRSISGFPAEAYRTVALAADPTYPNTQYRINVYSIDAITPQEEPVLMVEARASDGTLLESLEWQYLDGGLEFDNAQAFSVTENIAYIVITFNRPPGGDPLDVGVELEEFEESAGVQVVAVNDTYTVAANSTAQTLNVYQNDTIDGQFAEDYNEPWGTEIFTPPTHGSITRVDNISFRYTPDPEYSGNDSFVYTLSAYDPITEDFVTDNATVSITVEGDEPPEVIIPPKRGQVFELDRGWTFDGAFIPHFLELNWYFGDNPITYHTIQKVRVHGLTKGNVALQLQTNGIQTSYLRDYNSPQYLDLKHDYDYVSSDFVPVTAYTDVENRGLAIQMKFEGRNTNIALPEPAHVIQVLVIQSSPDGTGFTAN